MSDDVATKILKQLSTLWCVSREGYMMPSSSLHMALIWRVMVQDKTFPEAWRMAAFYCACRLALLGFRDDEDWGIGDLFDTETEEFYDPVMDLSQTVEPNVFMRLVKSYTKELNLWFAGSRNVRTAFTEEP